MDASENAATQPEGEVIPRKSFMARLGGVLVSPGATFEDIARAPDFIAPLIAAIVASIAVTETLLQKVGMATIVQKSLEQSGRAQNMSADQIQAAVQRGATFGAIFARIGEVVGPPIFLLIVAAVGLLILNAFFGAGARFGPVFSAACYAYVPALVGALSALPVILFGDPNDINFQNPTPTNPGFFLNPLETSKPLYALASSLDLFRLWFVILLSIGLARVAKGQVKTGWIFGCYFGIWVVIVLARIGFAML